MVSDIVDEVIGDVLSDIFTESTSFVPPGPPVDVDRITELGDIRITEEGPTRITE